MSDLVSLNASHIYDIRNKIDLVRYFGEFSYPISLDLSESIGRVAYQEETLDALQILCILANKFYNNILHNPSEPEPILENFLIKESPLIGQKASRLIRSVKAWESGHLQDQGFATEIDEFCRMTYAIRIPAVSFLLRMLNPSRFPTLDVRVISALRKLGFQGIVDLPNEELDKDDYLQRFGGLEYLQYAKLLSAIGEQYRVSTKLGHERQMMPSEVDTALYTYDKSPVAYGRQQIPVEETKDATKAKIDEIMAVIEDIVTGVNEVAKEPWAQKIGYSGMLQSSANKLLKIMREYAQKNDLDGIWRYYQNAMRDGTGRKVGQILNERHQHSLESEYLRVQRIYNRK